MNIYKAHNPIISPKCKIYRWGGGGGRAESTRNPFTHIFSLSLSLSLSLSQCECVCVCLLYHIFSVVSSGCTQSAHLKHTWQSVKVDFAFTGFCVSLDHAWLVRLV